MKKLFFLFGICAILSLNINAQKSSITLSFDADNNGESVTFDSLKIQNLTQEGEVMLYNPVSTYEIVITNINEIISNNPVFLLSQNHPNPFNDQTNFEVQLLKKGNIDITIFNMLGEKVASYNTNLEAASHNFSFTPGENGYYYLMVKAFGSRKTISLICQESNGSQNKLEYLGINSNNSNFKSLDNFEDFPFAIGDQLLFVGYSSLGESGILDTPDSDTDYTLQFATNIPCIGEPTVEYGGQIYNTIQIFSQCWMKENLNIGKMLEAPLFPTDNDTIEKYCLFNNEPYCDLVGGLYFWNEMMAYSTINGDQGICPEGWHIPIDLDWQVLEGAVDTEFGIGSSEWENNNWRGSDAGGNLKQTGNELWEPPNTGATDNYGFTAVPGGYYVQGDFWGAGWKGYYWTSNTVHRYFRNVDWDQAQVNKDGSIGSNIAFSIRCIQD